MSQESVFKCLQNAQKWLTAKEIQKKVKLSRSAVNTSLQKLTRDKKIIRAEIRGQYRNEFVYKANRNI